MIHIRNVLAGSPYTKSSRRICCTFVLFALFFCVSACSARPGSPPLQDTTATVNSSAAATSAVDSDVAQLSSAAQNSSSTAALADAARSARVKNHERVIGIDAIAAGFNPHLLADDSDFVRMLAELVLPSAFVRSDSARQIESPDYKPVGEFTLNTALLTSAEVLDSSSDSSEEKQTDDTIPSSTTTIRYTIDPEAQWSDGTPITGADFRFLWQSLTSTPGVVDGAPYQFIEDIHTSNAGKTVDVVLSQPLDDWHVLFRYLLPSHLFLGGASDFAQSLSQNIPASAGHFRVSSVDRGRGVVTVLRNDRYWGSDVASLETITFREVRDVHALTQLIRTGSLDAARVTPEETTGDAVASLPSVDMNIEIDNRRLDIVFNTSSRVLTTPARREKVAEYFDTERVAILATGRRTNLALPAGSERPVFAGSAEPDAAIDFSSDSSLRIGVDATDDVALQSAYALADIVEPSGITITVVPSTMADLADVSLPTGDVDAVLTWQTTGDTPLTLAGSYLCFPESWRSTNLSGYCSADVDVALKKGVSDGMKPEEVRALYTSIESSEVLTIPILYENIVHLSLHNEDGTSGEADTPESH